MLKISTLLKIITFTSCILVALGHLSVSASPQTNIWPPDVKLNVWPPDVK